MGRNDRFVPRAKPPTTEENNLANADNDANQN